MEKKVRDALLTMGGCPCLLSRGKKPISIDVVQDLRPLSQFRLWGRIPLNGDVVNLRIPPEYYLLDHEIINIVCDADTLVVF